MPESPSLLLRAARTHKREDRLTELLAVVLRGHRGFAHLLLAKATLQALGDVEVSTQWPTARGKLVDMQLVSLDANGTVVGRLWSEHKTGSAYGRGQMEGYADDLAGVGGPGQLITIVDFLDEAPESPRWKCFTWRDIAVLAWEAGRDAAGPAWREAALSPDGPARQLLLLELLSYLEEEHGTVVSPVTEAHAATLVRTGETYEVFVALLDLVADRSSYDPVDEVFCAADLSQYWQQFDADDTWAGPLDGYLELTIIENDEWAGSRAAGPAFGAGFNLPGDLEARLRSSACERWRTLLEAEGVTVTKLDGAMLVYRTLYLADLITEGPTIDAQARVLAKWADESFGFVSAHDPMVTRPERVKRTRGKTASRASRASDEPGSSQG